MHCSVTDIWRHPVKSHGREQLAEVHLAVGRTIPWDRTWAVTHEATRPVGDSKKWMPPSSFSTCRSSPSLAVINVVLDEDIGRLTLTHPDLGEVSVDLDDPDDGRRFIDWVRPLVPENRAQPAAVYRADSQNLTDIETPLISINSHASLAAVSARAGEPVSPLRWRGNIWVDGVEPWREFDWIGKTIRIGSTELLVVDPIGRCQTTSANPETGQRDYDMPAFLEDGWGHQNFGVYAEVVSSGHVRIGDSLAVVG